MYRVVEKWLQIYFKCIINVILYYRNVYPRESFDWTTYQAFNLPRHIPLNRHPQLQEYVETLITDVISKLEHIKNFNLRIVNQEDGVCIERYVLDFSEFRHNEVENTTEEDVFDEMRSSLNSLIAQLEKLPKVRPGSVTFEVVIDSEGLELGHKMNRVHTLKERLEQERDTNWVKCSEDSFTVEPNSRRSEDPRIKMISLAGCDSGPLVIYQFIERLLAPSGESLSQVYESSQTSESSALFS
ncbi:LAQU0S11e00408g1_1 [Lachancea quebecensis]|uniref:LAQU0S11e00408g1_1 n=1 Tax=Lachancea quebecensis TaxID=1654605 RepID=A0A0P1KUQ1_9SACH|nr:LAQU0S11e00408g1_1 [Lachancea quebecensis]